MSERIPIALIGCVGMGRRHLRGMQHLAASSHANVDLVAACDLNQSNANFLADEAADLLGRRPRVYADIPQMARELGLTCTQRRLRLMLLRTTRLLPRAWRPDCTCCAKSRWR